MCRANPPYEYLRVFAGRSIVSDLEDVVIKGRAVFPPGERSGAAARVVVRVEDVSVADAPSTTVAQNVLDKVRLPSAEGDSLPFEIRVPKSALDPKRRYSVRIHVDVDGTGTITTGDFLSTRAYPVQTEQPDQPGPVVQMQPV
jgi:uncharacterized lipoprotein YbaY